MNEGHEGRTTIDRLFKALTRGWQGAFVAGLTGALLLSLFGVAAGGRYRAEASVLVHHNTERVVEDPTSDEAYGYINRETLVLETLAYADAVWDPVVERLSIEGLLGSPDEALEIFEALRLPHPKDGEWRFTAWTKDPAVAARVANLWAESFVRAANDGVGLAVRQEALAAQIEAEAQALAALHSACDSLAGAVRDARVLSGQIRSSPPSEPAQPGQILLAARLAAQIEGGTAVFGASATDTVSALTQQVDAIQIGLEAEEASCLSAAARAESRLTDYTSQAAELAQSQLGISPWLEVALLREAGVPSAPSVETAEYMVVGAGIGLLLWLLWALDLLRFATGRRRSD